MLLRSLRMRFMREWVRCLVLSRIEGMHGFSEFAVVAAFYSMAWPTVRWVAVESKDSICHGYRYSWRRFVRYLFDPGIGVDDKGGGVPARVRAVGPVPAFPALIFTTFWWHPATAGLPRGRQDSHCARR